MIVRRFLSVRPAARVSVAVRKWRVAVASFGVAVLVALSATGAAASPASFPLQHGFFYTQTGGGGGLGYSVVDAPGAPIWTSFQGLGGHELLGYPISQPWHAAPFVYQAFQRAVLQVGPDGEVRPANIYDVLSSAGHDPWLLDFKGIPPSTLLPADTGPLARLEVLSAASEVTDFWRASPNALTRFGLPLGYASAPDGGVLRAQRAVLRLSDGQVRLAPAGDHFKQAGMIPAPSTVPLAPPRIPRPLVEAHSPLVTSVAFDPSGATFATGGYDRRVVIWDRATLTPIHELLGHFDGIYEVAYSPDGSLLASASEDDTVRLWDTRSGEQVHVLQADERWFTSVAFSPDGTLVAATTYAAAHVWDVATGEHLAKFDDIDAWSNGVAFTPDGGGLITSGWARADIWDMATGERLLEFIEQHSRAVLSLAISPDGTRLATGADDNTAVLWDATNGSALATLAGHSDSVWQVAFSPNGRRVATSSSDGTVGVWDVATATRLYSLTGHTTDVQGLSFSPDGEILLSGSWDGDVGVWLTALSELAAETALPASGNAVDYSPLGTSVAAALDNGWLVIVGTDGAIRASVAAHDRPARVAAYSPDGQIVASGGDDGRVRLWDAAHGALLSEAPAVPDSVTALTFAADGHLLAGDARGVVRRLDPSNGAENWAVMASGPITALATDGSGLAAVGTYREVLLLDAATGAERLRLTGLDDWIRAIRFAPRVAEMALADGAAIKILASGSNSLLREIEPEAGLITSLAYRPVGDELAIGVYQRALLRDPTGSLKLGRAIDAHIDWIRAVAYSPDGALLATVGDDRALRFWITRVD
ncbi:MAG: WD40 repeat domain-containing protein [Chloroflexota bacterium]|nr:WD40 repeat domain-containing protein [Chloroflexota bacterium]